MDHRVKRKDGEKKKYSDLVRELKKKMWNMRLTVIPVVVGALGTVSKGMEKRWSSWKSEVESRL